MTVPKFDPPDGGVKVSPFGPMESTCNAYGCSKRTGLVINIGGIHIRLCGPHAADLRRRLEVSLSGKWSTKPIDTSTS